MHLKKIAFPLLMVSALLLTSCDNDPHGAIVKDEDPAVTLQNFIKEQDKELKSKVNTPAYPASEARYETILGVDSNSNDVRDDVENVLFQHMRYFLLNESDDSTFKEVLAIAKMLHPNEPPISDSISREEIYCAYQALPEEVKDTVSLSFIYFVVHDTKERKLAFDRSLRSNEGEVKCD